MGYDEYLNSIEKKDGDLVYASLVSLLPFFPLSMKLLERKNRGKKPFSDGFDYKNKVLQIKDTEEKLKRELDSFSGISEEMKRSLTQFTEILNQAKEEIKNQGLKNDFIYMMDEIENVLSLR